MSLTGTLFHRCAFLTGDNNRYNHAWGVVLIFWVVLFPIPSLDPKIAPIKSKGDSHSYFARGKRIIPAPTLFALGAGRIV
jgi:hypothetical protein